ncbi:MAG: hypothetical protein BroJett025_07650 [Patescibacteria group bacterium]|nr:MAG: hypothetical protein BroJett025_07650 [Patescibacteria group bacterium]
MNSRLQNKTFLNADQEVVMYDGSEITWRVSAYAVITKNDTVLIIKNRKEKLHDIVGGGIEFGETIEETLAREGLEEGGAKIKIGELLHAETNWFYHFSNKKYHQTLQLFYSATLDGELSQPTEKNIEWRGFVPVTEIGTTYHLPRNVEAVIKQKCKIK